MLACGLGTFGLPVSDARVHWDECTFQSIRHDPIDQFVFSLLGGTFDRWRTDFLGSHHCSVWQRAVRGHKCSCSAPAELVGSGVFVEIGANDGLHMSNSWFFEKTLGWKGICVEANPSVFKALKINRPGCTNVNALVGVKNGTAAASAPFISFYRTREKAKVANDWETGLSGIEGSNNETLRNLATAQAFAHRAKGLEVRRDMLPIRTFADIFAENNISQIDFMSLDVEGHELDVLRSINFSKVRVRIIATETTTPESQLLLTDLGYRDLGLQFPLKDRVFVLP